MKKFELAPYLPTPKESYETIFELGELTPGEVFYDLGAGNFDLVIRAAKDPYYARSVGIEKRKDLVNFAQEKVKMEGLQDRVKIIHGDILNSSIDISYAKLVYLFLTEIGNALVRPKLEEQLPNDARVISKEYLIPEWVYSNCKVVRAPIVIFGKTSPPIQHYFYLYKMNEIRKKY